MENKIIGDYFESENVVKNYDNNVMLTIPFYSECIKYISKVVEEFQKGKKTNLLELGVGTGNLLCAILDSIDELNDLYCLDMSNSMLSLARSKIIQKVGAIKDFNFIQKTFQDSWDIDIQSRPTIITSMMCFSHLLEDSEAKQLFHKCYQVLDSNGLFIMAEKCASSEKKSRIGYERMISSRAILLEKEGILSHKEIKNWKYHVLEEDKIRSLKEWVTLLESVGFTIMKCSGVKLPDTNFTEKDFSLLKKIEEISSSTDQALGMGMIFCVKK